MHVKFVLGEVGAEKVPLGADHAYVRPPGFTPVAAAPRATEPLTVVSDGRTETELTDAQL